MTLPNDWAVGKVIGIQGTSAPDSSWTEDASGDFAWKFVTWANEDELESTGYEAIQHILVKKTNGSAPAMDRFDGNDGYGLKLRPNGNIMVQKANGSGPSDSKVFEYTATIGASPAIGVWPSNLAVVPLEGVRSPDAGASTSIMNAVNALGYADFDLYTPA